jgi:hypothetical protein
MDKIKLIRTVKKQMVPKVGLGDSMMDNRASTIKSSLLNVKIQPPTPQSTIFFHFSRKSQRQLEPNCLSDTLGLGASFNTKSKLARALRSDVFNGRLLLIG